MNNRLTAAAVARLELLPRVSLGRWPTPLEPAPRLTAALGGPDIWIKRDDLSTLALGGNKVRKLEFLLGDALAQGADVVLTVGGVQSNHSRQTAAAAARVGLRCILILNGQAGATPQGNLLLDELLGAEVRLYPGISAAERDRIMHQTAEGLRAQGHHPYAIPLGASTGLGAMGYTLAARELAEQAEALGMALDGVVVSSSSGGTQAGLLLGQRLFDLPWAVWGISPDLAAAELRSLVADVASQGAALLGLSPVRAAQVLVYDDYVGPGYGIMTPVIKEAIHLAARTEGVFLDPVYTAKTMTGLIDLVRRGVLVKGQTIVFWHTGGTPTLFAYAQELAPAA
jgi:D-cysteine desulfhydrase family pyridoxal phosphate-dependent enzyme